MQDGKVSKIELILALRALYGANLTTDTAKSLLALIDCDKDGKVDLNEFYKAVKVPVDYLNRIH
jgi:Ca2+-binding EF-hand superfamily protein